MRMIVNDIILSVRQRLGDTKDKKRWSDEELIDSINAALSAITMAVNPFTSEWAIRLVDGQSRYELPPYFYRLINVKFNDKIIPEEHIKGYEWLQKNLGCLGRQRIVSADLHHFYIYPSVFNEKRVALEKEIEVTTNIHEQRKLRAELEAVPYDKAFLTYNYEEQVAYIKDVINLPERFSAAIVFYVMHLAHQTPVLESAENKSMHYLNLYQNQIKKLSEQVYANKHSRKIRSLHIKV